MHFSLRAMVAWSWDVCTRAEQTLWARCSIFPEGAGWDLAAATHICTDRTGPQRRPHPPVPARSTSPPGRGNSRDIEGQDVLMLLDALVDKHIVVADTTGTHTRYRMLGNAAAVRPGCPPPQRAGRDPAPTAQ